MCTFTVEMKAVPFFMPCRFPCRVSQHGRGGGSTALAGPTSLFHSISLKRLSEQNSQLLASPNEVFRIFRKADAARRSGAAQLDSVRSLPVGKWDLSFSVY